jgi:hypothetical protein
MAEEAPVIRSRARSWRGTQDPVAEGDCECGRTGARRDWVRRAAARADASQDLMTVAHMANGAPGES